MRHLDGDLFLSQRTTAADRVTLELIALGTIQIDRLTLTQRQKIQDLINRGLVITVDGETGGFRLTNEGRRRVRGG